MTLANLEMSMSENMQIWDAVSRPPKEALKQIGGGRLKGMTDINPQWRYEVMTKTFGICGIGWKIDIKRLWTEPGFPKEGEQEVFAFAEVHVFVKVDGAWSDPIPGIGGNLLIESEYKGMHNNDEAFKMAVTDAIGTAIKMLGVGSDIYAGRWDGSKYRDKPADKPKDVPLEDKKLSAEAQSWVDAINQADCLEDLHAVGDNLKGESPEVQNAVRAFYAMKLKALKAKK
jgi:hypothetical protein